jgi:hypothetical protein
MVKPKGSKAPSVKQAAFLAAYSKTGVVTVAAEMAGVHRRNHPFWLQNDKDYPALPTFNEAHAVACDTIEAEMRRRAIEGVDKPVFYKGQQCGTVKEYSDMLLAMLANGAMPEKYKQKTKIEAEVTTSREVVREGLRKLTDEELAEYERLLTKAMGQPQENIDLAAVPPASETKQ